MLKEILLLTAVFYKDVVFGGYTRGCYYTNWAQYRNGIGKYIPENYQVGLCTHIFYAFAAMTSDYQISAVEWNDLNSTYSEGMYSQVVDFKSRQPGLKVLLSFGGYNFCQTNMDLLNSLASSSSNRQTFISSVLNLVNMYKFDGFDIDWEYPSVASDFTALLNDFRKSFDSNNPRLLLTVAASANPNTIQTSYEGANMGPLLDMLNIMTYDFHGSWEMVTGQNSPLYDRNNDQFSISNAVGAWEASGFPKNKINVGLAAYGHGWILQSASNNGVDAPATGPSPAQPYTGQAGTIAYYEVCPIVEEGGQQTFDDCQKCPDVVFGAQWYSYDNVDSFNIKMNWLKQNGLAGAFVWTLDMDDFNAVCKSSYDNKYPLITAMNQNLGPFGPPTLSTVLQRSTTRAVKQSTANSGSFVCPGAGLYPNPNSCYSFYNCVSQGNGVLMNCGAGECFNPTITSCDYIANCPSCS